MARTITNSGKGPIFPDGTGDFVKRRLFDAAGLTLMTAAVAGLAALTSFSPGDPSLNNATDLPASNLLGSAGSYIADALLQSVGLAGILPIAVLAAWGWQLMYRQKVPALWARFVMMLSAVALIAVALGTVPPPTGWPLNSGIGGAAGELLLHYLSRLLVPIFGPASLAVVVGAAAGLGLGTLVVALGLTLADWKAAGQGLAVAGTLAARLARLGLDKLRRGPAEENGAGSTTRLERREPTLGGPASAFQSPERIERKVVAKAPRPKAGKQAAAERQPVFDLGIGKTEGYQAPPLDILAAPPAAGRGEAISKTALEQNARLLEGVLEDFGVKGQITHVRPGPVVTLYELEPAPGTKTSRVIGLADDIARSMSAVSVRVAVVPGRNVIGIEMPNTRRETVHLRELLASEDMERAGTPGRLILALGKDIGGGPVMVDLARMPHLLIAGTTGSGKSVAINTMILSLLYRLPPEACRLIMVDPKMLELSVYDGIPHLLAPVVTDPSKAVVALKWAVREMEDRYRLMSQLGVRNIAGYNQRIAEAARKGESLTRRVQTGFDDQGKPQFEDLPLASEPLPFIVVVVDEMADLMLVAGKDIEAAVQRLAQMARAAGIHLIMATQRPSVDVITGTIKANFPTRVSFQVTSKIDSRTILGEQGAEQLLGQGDMLYMAGGGRISRVHGPFVSDAEVESVVNHLKAQGEPAYVEAVTEEDDTPVFGMGGAMGGEGEGGESDGLYDQAVAIVTREGKASTSFVQRHLQIGYNRAARIVERMEAEGVVSKADRVGRREVLAPGVAAE
ncbi:MAG: DNA translocase FtsK 4TM domain-containing protein [Magnetospirillum sp. WYHS-4]